MKQEKEYLGLGVASGIAIGVAYLRETSGLEIPERTLKKAHLEPEMARLDKAVKLARRQIRRLQYRANSIPGAVSEELGFLLEAYQQMLEDSRLIRGAQTRILENRVNAEAAIQSEQ